MKVNNTINAANTNLAAITNKQTAAEAAKNKAGKVSFGRFDTFTKVDEPEKKTARSAEDSELIKNLDRLSDEEKAEVAFSSYLDLFLFSLSEKISSVIHLCVALSNFN